MSVGGSFERSICRKLSLWWTNGKRDDVFWRTHGSGGRATMRLRGGRSTKHQYGDVYDTDPVARPLIDFATIELKKGYNNCTLAYLLDRKHDSKDQLKLEEWIVKADWCHQHAGSYTWMLVHQRRNSRECVVILPTSVVTALKKVGGFPYRPLPYVGISCMVLYEHRKRIRIHYRLSAMLLNDFLRAVKPQNIRDLLKRA